MAIQLRIEPSEGRRDGAFARAQRPAVPLGGAGDDAGRTGLQMAAAVLPGQPLGAAEGRVDAGLADVGTQQTVLGRLASVETGPAPLRAPVDWARHSGGRPHRTFLHLRAGFTDI